MTSSINLKKIVNSLPIPAKKILISVYDKARKTMSEQESFNLAINAVRQKYTKKNGNWVIKKSVTVQTTIAKSGLFKPKYYFDAVIDDSNPQNSYYPTSTLLQQLYSDNKIDELGDIEHMKLDNDDKFNGIFRLTNKIYKDNKLYGRFEIVKEHQHYKEFLKMYPRGIPFGLSAEYLNPIVEGKRIISCERMGWSITDNPANNRAGVYAAY